MPPASVDPLAVGVDELAATADDAAVEAALGVASAGEQLRNGLSAIDSPLVNQIVDLPGTLSEAATALGSGTASITATSEESINATARNERTW